MRAGDGVAVGERIQCNLREGVNIPRLPKSSLANFMKSIVQRPWSLFSWFIAETTLVTMDFPDCG